MQRALPFFRRFLSKFALEILPAALASVAAGATLTYLHLGRAADPPAAQTVAVQADEPTVQSQRELTRQILKARRENAELPAQVTPRPEREAVASAATEAPAETSGEAAAAVPSGDGKPRAGKEIAVRATAGVPASEASAPAAPAADQPQVIGEPIVITAPREVAMQAEAPPGPVGAVFSAVSVLTGKAVNATGDTLSWVVELPGRIVATGGRLLEKSPPAVPRKEAL